MYIVKWCIRKYPPHSPTFAHFYSQKCSFAASWTLWHLSLTSLVLVCCLTTNYLVRASPHWFAWLMTTENWLVILIVQMFLIVWLFFSEKLSLADRALSLWLRFLTITNGGHLPILALCAHSAPASNGETMGSPIPGKGSHCFSLVLLHVKVHRLVWGQYATKLTSLYFGNFPQNLLATSVGHQIRTLSTKMSLISNNPSAWISRGNRV